MISRAAGWFFAVLAGVGSSGCAFDGERRLESFTVEDEVSALAVDLGSGNVTVRGTDADETSVEARILGEYCELVQDYASGTLRLESHHVGGHPLRRRCDIELDVSLPAGADLVLDTGSGNVDAARIDGAVDVDTGSGNVDLAEVAGDLRVETGSGNIDAVALRSPNAYAHAGSGNVKAAFADPPDALAVETGSGNVRLRLPEERYRVDTDVGSGEVHVTGIVNDPDAERWVAVDTGSGNIDITGT
jgi:DUF4097 and DUF4098 domain-containing protein YvlB